jgi:hypothetical protein
MSTRRLSTNFRGLRLTNVGDPVDGYDAVNVHVLLQLMKLWMPREYDEELGDSFYNFNNFILRNIKTPNLKSDAASKGYVDVKLPLRDGDDCSFENKRLKNVAAAENDEDAPNWGQVRHLFTNLAEDELLKEFYNHLADPSSLVVLRGMLIKKFRTMIDEIVDEARAKEKELKTGTKTIDEIVNDAEAKQEELETRTSFIDEN